MSRDEARALARHFAAHLSHLRQFRGLAYVGAAPVPTRAAATDPAAPASRAPEATWPSGQPTPASRTPEPTWPSGQQQSPSRTSEATWPSGQPASSPQSTRPPIAAPSPRDAGPTAPMSVERHDAPPRSAGSDLPAGAPRDRHAAPRPTPIPERPTWPSGQAEPARPQAAAAPVRVPPAAERAPQPVRLPLAAEPRPADSGVRDQARTWSAAEKLDYLRRKNLGNCQRCKLAGTRTNIVFGVGDPEADLMFIGEAPGFDEDRSGEPFVGAAGRRLTQWLTRLGLGREQVYIANVLKCRPPGNRDPEADEVERCSPFLQAQIRAIAPKVIVALGRHAGMLLLGGGHDRTLREMRGRSWTYRDPKGSHDAPLFVTYHPSYVIRREKELPPGQRNPADDTVMADLQQALQKLRGA